MKITAILLILIAIALIVMLIMLATGKQLYDPNKDDYYNCTKNNKLVTYDGEIDNRNGPWGEYLVYKKLKKLPGYKRILANCIVPYETMVFHPAAKKPDHPYGFTNNIRKCSEIDLILLHETGIYVVESKNYSGWIKGDENQEQWEQIKLNNEGNENRQFQNPINQNKGHISSLLKYLKYPYLRKNVIHIYEDPDKNYKDDIAKVAENIKIKSYIVFGEQCNIKDVVKDEYVLTGIRHLNKYLGDEIKNSDKVLNKEQIDAIFNLLLPLTAGNRNK